MFNFIKQKLKKVFSSISSKLSSFWNKSTIDEKVLKELELILLQADTGFETTKNLISSLKKEAAAGDLKDGNDLYNELYKLLTSLLDKTGTFKPSSVYLLVGVNGCGKTTLASKLAHKEIGEKKRPLLVAADTFRAAATEQLATWADRAGCPIVKGAENQDPASVVFAGMQKFKDESFDTLIVDTAGRLQNKANLMAELTKIKRVISRHLPETTICTLLTVDAMLGQNSFEQAKLFHESTHLNGIVLTKMDSTGKGGIIFSIAEKFNVPIAYISFGEQPTDLKQFNAQEYVKELLGK